MVKNRTVYIVHYHLNTGGVTRIVQSQVLGLKAYYPAGSIRVLTGGMSDRSFFDREGIEVKIHPGIQYFSERDAGKVHALHTQLQDFFYAILQSEDILHVHNLNLGKNPVLTQVVYQLSQSGFRVFNHAHDFAEDRPQNLEHLQYIIEDQFGGRLRDVLYPPFPDYRFGVLTQYDSKRLMDEGVDGDRIHYVPNPVQMQEMDGGKKEESHNELCDQLNIHPRKPIITYPVRVIRRKNIGEFILLAILFSGKFHWVVTQAPKNPVEMEPYHAWVDFCRKNGIPVIFEAGNQVDYLTLIHASAYCITTSYMEGFGMVYLEPWLLDTPVIGRNIAYATRDFSKNGIEFPMLYDSLTVSYGEKTLDFKDFKMDEQMEIILQCLQDQAQCGKIIRNNPFLLKMNQTTPTRVINTNKTIIRKKYSIQKYGERLHDVYKRFAG